MSSKEPAQRNGKDAAKKQTAQPEVQSPELLDQQTKPATLIQQARLDASSLSSREMQQLQRTIGNRAVNNLLTGTGQAQGVQPKPDSGYPAHTFANGQTLYLKQGEYRSESQAEQALPSPELAQVEQTTTQPSADAIIQRKLGNRGKVGDWVWREGSQAGQDLRGKIARINKAWGLKASLKHKNIVRKVTLYYVRMDDRKIFPADEQVYPDDKAWHLTSPADRERKEAAEEEGEGDVEEVKGDDERLMSGASTMSKLKGGVAAGKTLAGFASGYAKKTKYLEGDVDKAVIALADCAKWANRAGTLFPPLKLITSPLSSAVGGVNKLRQAGRITQLLASEQGRPLVFVQLSEAAEKLEKLAQDEKISDEENMIEKAQEAIWTLQQWLEKLSEVGGEEEHESTPDYD